MDACILKFAAVLSYVYWPWVHLYFISTIFNHMIWSFPGVSIFLCLSVGRICEINKNPEFSRPKQKFLFPTTPSCDLQCLMPENVILQMKQLQAIVILCKYNDFEHVKKIIYVMTNL